MFTVTSRKIQSAVCMILSAVIVSCQPVARCLRRRTRCPRRLLGDDHADPVSPRPLPALPFRHAGRLWLSRLRSAFTKLAAMDAPDFIAARLTNDLPTPIAQQVFASCDGDDDVACFAVLRLSVLCLAVHSGEFWLRQA